MLQLPCIFILKRPICCYLRLALCTLETYINNGRVMELQDLQLYYLCHVSISNTKPVVQSATSLVSKITCTVSCFFCLTAIYKWIHHPLQQSPDSIIVTALMFCLHIVLLFRFGEIQFCQARYPSSVWQSRLKLISVLLLMETNKPDLKPLSSQSRWKHNMKWL